MDHAIYWTMRTNRTNEGMLFCVNFSLFLNSPKLSFTPHKMKMKERAEWITIRIKQKGTGSLIQFGVKNYTSAFIINVLLCSQLEHMGKKHADSFQWVQSLLEPFAKRPTETSATQLAWFKEHPKNIFFFFFLRTHKLLLYTYKPPPP